MSRFSQRSPVPRLPLIGQPTPRVENMAAEAKILSHSGNNVLTPDLKARAISSINSLDETTEAKAKFQPDTGIIQACCEVEDNCNAYNRNWYFCDESKHSPDVRPWNPK